MSKEQKKNLLIFSFSGVLLVFLMIFSGVRNNGRSIENLDVDVAKEDGVFFTDELEVIDLMTDTAGYLVGIEAREMDPRTLEARVEANPFVKEAQVFRDVEGNLQVSVTQSKPIARVFINGSDDKYIDMEGRVLPVNAKHTARVPLLETEFAFSWEQHMGESSYGEQVFELLRFIEKDSFWNAQIAHIFLRKDGEIELYPQVTKQTVLIGRPVDLDEKFSKLMTFYKEILPKKGWNHYSKVNVKFKDQIVCE